MPVYREITCKTACHRLPAHSRLPYRLDLNPYRGCAHACQYCFAQYSHRYLDAGAYFNEIYVKTNIAERLEHELANPNRRREVINLGGVTDSYQPAEERYQLMPDIWKLLIRYRNPCIISTKSDLILRDFDLIQELSCVAEVAIASTITCMDDKIRQKIEPGAVSSARRFAMLRTFSQKTKAATGMHIMPVIPYLTDTDENLEGLFRTARENEIDYAITDVLNLRGQTKTVFFRCIRQYFPELLQPLQALYPDSRAGQAYQAQLAARIGRLHRKYGLISGYRRKPPEEEVQLKLF